MCATEITERLKEFPFGAKSFTAWSDGSIIYHGDAMSILPRLIDKGLAADMLLSDPPYKLTSGGKSGLMRGCFDPERYSNNGSIVKCDIDWPDFMPLLYAALAEQADCYTMANNRNVQAMLNAAEAAGFDFHNLLVWDKRTATANRWYMKNCEFVGYFYKGNSRQINDCSATQLLTLGHKDESQNFSKDGAAHSTEKPVALMSHYIKNSSQPGDLILDPFAGSFSTGVACVLTGRRFIGIEIEEKYYDMAVKRIGNAHRNIQKLLL